MKLSTDDSAPTPFVPGEAWIEAFATQCTDEMRTHAKIYAARRLRIVGKTGEYVDDYAARELVQDALGDTLMGVVTWEPTSKSLQQHIEDVIKSRTFHRRKHATTYRHHRVDAFDPDSEKFTARVDLEASLAREHGDDGIASALYASAVVEQVRELAQCDKPVLRFLDAIMDGARTRTDIMEVAGMSLKTFRNARGRLRRLVDRLDSQTVAPLRQA